MDHDTYNGLVYWCKNDMMMMFRYIWFIINIYTVYYMLQTGIVLTVKVCLNYKKCTFILICCKSSILACKLIQVQLSFKS